MEQCRWARVLAGELLGSGSRRLAHSEGVGNRAVEMCGRLPVALRKDVVAAAFLHDIGYSPAVRATGFHALDGALYLVERGLVSVAGLVARHSASDVEAEVRGFGSALERFEVPEPLAADALTYCDVTTGPTGGRVTVDERLQDVRERYHKDDPVRVAIDLAEPELRAAVARIEDLLVSSISRTQFSPIQ